jgi:class 3 adenylate cyclase/predicted ATPase
LDGERKTVTFLFADIKGSMDLMEDLDPEEAQAIVDPALKLMMDAVHHYGGYVAQPTGDGIFAMFGAPVAHEDHPQRALFAALRLQEEMRRYSAKLRAAGNLPVEARVGVNTGEVVVRSITTGQGNVEYAPIGHSTGLAARMQALAPTWSIATTDPVRKLCEGYFTFRTLGPTKVKGVTEPVDVYEVTGFGPLRTRLQRSASRGYTKFVGRTREMEALGHCAGLARQGHGQIVAAMAEPGVGKSRLLFEFKAKNQSGWMVLEALSVSYGKATAYLPLVDLLHSYFKISDKDDQRARRAKVTGNVFTLDRTLEDTLPHLFGLLGISEDEDPLAQMDPQVRRRRTQEAVKRVLLRESLNQSLMLIFEDLHWVDEETQGFLNLLVESMANARVLLLVNYRPEYSHHWNSKTYYTQLRLDPLGKESAEEKLSTLLGDDAELAPLRRVIIEKTEGNPLFMEEIFQALVEDGTLQRNGSVKLVRPVEQLRLPPTVQGILAARIDHLRSEEKELLQTLAVIGMEFPLSLVRQIVQQPPEQLDGLLGDLQTSEFIYEQPTVSDIEYTFKHALTQEVAYNSVLIERRKQLHELAGRALESIFAAQLEEHLDELARHYSASYNIAKGVKYLELAGQQAAERSAYADAVNRLTAALDLLRKLPSGTERIQRELILQLALGGALVATQGWAPTEVERTYTRARDLCEQLGDPSEFFPALNGLWAVHALRGELQKAHVLAEQLLQRAQVNGDPGLVMYAHYALGFTLFWMGEFLSAREHLETTITLYSTERHHLFNVIYGFDAGVNSLSYAAWTLWHLGYPEQALNRANEALALAQRLSNPGSLTFAKGTASAVSQSRREVHATREHAENAIQLAIERGFTELLPIVNALRGWAIAEKGRHEQGILQIREGLESGTELVRLYLLSLLAEACEEPERLDDARSGLIEALAATNRNQKHCHNAEADRLIGELLLRHSPEPGSADQISPPGAHRVGSNALEARKCFERSITTARGQSAKSWELRATMSLARLLAKQGNRDEARTMLAEIYNWFTEGFDTADLKDAKALLSELTG